MTDSPENPAPAAAAEVPPVAAAIRVTGGAATDEELAAVTAVLTVALEQLANESRRTDPGQTAWQRSQRATRIPLSGGWSDF